MKLKRKYVITTNYTVVRPD